MLSTSNILVVGISSTTQYQCGEVKSHYTASSCCSNEDMFISNVQKASSSSLRARIFEYEPHNDHSCSHYYTLPGFNYCKGGHVSIGRWGSIMKGEAWPADIMSSDGHAVTGAIPSIVWPSLAPFPMLFVPSAIGDPVPNTTAQDKMRVWYKQIQQLPEGDEKTIKNGIYHGLKAYQIIFRIEEMTAKNDPAANLDNIMEIFFGNTSLQDPADKYEYAPFYKSLQKTSEDLRETNFLDVNGKFPNNSFAEHFFCANQGFLRNMPQGTFTKDHTYGGWDTFYEGRCTITKGHATFNVAQFTFHNCMSHMMGTMNSASLSNPNPIQHVPIDFVKLSESYGRQIEEFNNIFSIVEYGVINKPLPFKIGPNPINTSELTSTFPSPVNSVVIGTVLAKFLETHKSIGRERPFAANTVQGNIMLHLMNDLQKYSETMQCTEENVHKFTDASKVLGRFVNYARSDWSSIPFTTESSYIALKTCKLPNKFEPHYVYYGDVAMGGSGMIENFGTPNPYITFEKLYLKFVCRLALEIETRCDYPNKGPVPDVDRNFSSFSPIEKKVTLARYVAVWPERIKDAAMSMHSAKPLYRPVHDVCYAGAELGDAKLLHRDTMTDQEMKDLINGVLRGSSGGSGSTDDDDDMSM